MSETEEPPTAGIFVTMRLWRRLIKHFTPLGQLTFSEKPEVCKRKDVPFLTWTFVKDLNKIKKEFASLVFAYPTPKDCLNLPTKLLMKKDQIDKQMDLLGHILALIKKVKPYLEEEALTAKSLLEEKVEIEKALADHKWAIEVAHLMFTQVSTVCESNIAEDGLFLSRYTFERTLEKHAKHMREVKHWQNIVALRKRKLEASIEFEIFRRSLKGVLDLNKEYICQLAVRECGTCFRIRQQGTPTYRCEHNDELTLRKNVLRIIDAYGIFPATDSFVADLTTLAQVYEAMSTEIKKIQAILDSDYKKYLLPLQIGLHDKIKKREEILEARIEEIKAQLLDLATSLE